MAQKSNVEHYDPRVKAEVDRLIREGRATIDEIVAHVRKLGEDNVSRSGIGRYRKNALEQWKVFKEAQDMAKIWAGKMAEDPESDVGRLLSQTLRAIAYMQMNKMTEPGEIKTKEIAMLAGALRDISNADKIMVDREQKIRQAVIKEAIAAVETEAKAAGTDKTGIDLIKKRLLNLK